MFSPQRLDELLEQEAQYRLGLTKTIEAENSPANLRKLGYHANSMIRSDIYFQLKIEAQNDYKGPALYQPYQPQHPVSGGPGEPQEVTDNTLSAPRKLRGVGHYKPRR